ncbi:hypothetical protein ACFL6R_00810 [Gemmatimonadota bacterium]
MSSIHQKYFVRYSLLVCIFLSSSYQLHAQNTLNEKLPELGAAWNLAWVSDGTKGPSASFGFVAIYSVVQSDDMEWLYVLDSESETIWIMSPQSGEVIGNFGREGSGPGEFQTPFNMEWSNGGLWISDPSLNRVSRFSKSGDYQYSVILKEMALHPAHMLVHYSDDQIILHRRFSRGGTPLTMMLDSAEGAGTTTTIISDSEARSIAPSGSEGIGGVISSKVIVLDSNRLLLAFMTPPIIGFVPLIESHEMKTLVDLRDVIGECAGYVETSRASMAQCWLSAISKVPGSESLSAIIHRQSVSRTSEDGLVADKWAQPDVVVTIDSRSGEVLESRTVEFGEWTIELWRPKQTLYLTGTMNDVPVLLRYDYVDR